MFRIMFSTMISRRRVVGRKEQVRVCVVGCWMFWRRYFLLRLCRCFDVRFVVAAAYCFRCVYGWWWEGGGYVIKTSVVMKEEGLTVGIFWGINSDRGNQDSEILLFSGSGLGLGRQLMAFSGSLLLFSLLPPPRIVQCEGMCVCACVFVRTSRWNEKTGKKVTQNTSPAVKDAGNGNPLRLSLGLACCFRRCGTLSFP
jgi:hypothetical protein